MGEIKLPDYCNDCPIYGHHDCPVSLQIVEIRHGNRKEISLSNQDLEEKCGSFNIRNALASLRETHRKQIEEGMQQLERARTSAYFSLDPFKNVRKH